MADKATEVLSSLADLEDKLPQAIAELVEQQAAITSTLMKLRRLEKMVSEKTAVAKKPPAARTPGAKTAHNVRLARAGRLSPGTLKVAEVIKQMNADGQGEYSVAQIHQAAEAAGLTWTEGATRDAVTKLRAIEFIRPKGKFKAPGSPTPATTYTLLDADAVDRILRMTNGS